VRRVTKIKKLFKTVFGYSKKTSTDASSEAFVEGPLDQEQTVDTGLDVLTISEGSPEVRTMHSEKKEF
jgi:hypothetical protein